MLEIYTTEFDILNTIKEQFFGLALVGQRYDLLKLHILVMTMYDLVKYFSTYVRTYIPECSATEVRLVHFSSSHKYNQVL